MDEGIFFFLVFFGFLASIILIPIYLRERTRQSAHHLIAQALEKGQTLDPSLMKVLTEGQKKPRDKARSSLASGIVLLALAAGFVGGGFAVEQISGQQEALFGMLIPAAILGALGVAFVLLALVDFATQRKED